MIASGTGKMISLPLRSFAIWSVLTAVPAGCAPLWPYADWSDSPHISKTEVMRFAVDASCWIPSLFNPITGEHFYEVAELRQIPGERWQYEVAYHDAEAVVSRTVYVVQWWTAAGRFRYPRHYGAENCMVLIDVPQSKDGHRPYYVPEAKAKTAEYESAQQTRSVLLLSIATLVTVLILPAFLGFESAASRVLAAATALAILLSGLIGAHFWIQLPWEIFQKAQPYWQWFDALPKADGRLLPLSANEFWYLLGGPPNNTEFRLQEWTVGMIILAGAWLMGVGAAVVKGWYWMLVPLPLERIYERALAKGRTPTEEELEWALRTALAGKMAWQIDIMRRKAELFAARLGYSGWPPVTR